MNQHYNRKCLIAGNWKMNGDTNLLKRYQDSISSNEYVEVAIFPPSIFLNSFEKPNFSFGGQNLSEHEKGAYTGELSASMLAKTGCKYVLLGHSERRAYFGESNQDIVNKVKRTLTESIVPIICIGETEKEKECGETLKAIEEQIAPCIKVFKQYENSDFVIAYEPIWAIGTGTVAVSDDIQEAHSFIRQLLEKYIGDKAHKIRILYGGSVNTQNAKEIMSQPDVDGALIGGASLKVEVFSDIVEIAEKVTSSLSSMDAKSGGAAFV